MVVFKRALRFLLWLIVFFIISAILVFFKPDKSPGALAPLYEYPESDYYHWEGFNIHYRITGSGPTLILLHGVGASLNTWEQWTRVLQDQFQILSLDLPGFGLTGPDPTGVYHAARYSQLVSDLTKHLKIDKFHLAGNSLGGGIAWHFATQFPERVDKLILIDPTGIESNGSTSPLVIRLAKNRMLSPIVRWVTPRFLVEQSLLEVFEDDRKVNTQIVDRYFDLQLRKGNRRAFIDRARQDFFPDGRPSIAAVQSPTLIMWGEKDLWIPFEHAQLFADSISNSELISYPNAGHIPMEELPFLTAADARKFLFD